MPALTRADAESSQGRRHQGKPGGLCRRMEATVPGQCQRVAGKDERGRQVHRVEAAKVVLDREI